MSKIFVSILTYNRPDYYKQVISSIPRHKIDFLHTVNDGERFYVNSNDVDSVCYNQEQLGIAKSKNKALQFALDNGYEHIFLIEDDVLIKDENVFDVYIKHANTFGIHHLNFLKIAGNEKTIKYIHEAPNGCALGFYHNPQGAFQYYNASIIKKLGFFDENFKNAFEHVSHEYTLSLAKVVPPFWMFPDVLDSEKYLTTIEGSDENSTITNVGKYKENVQQSAEYFVKKHGLFTTQIHQPSINELKKTLMHLESNYSRKKLVNGDKKLQVIIPYRDREPALKQIIPKLHEVLSKQVKNYQISVIEQDDNALFNKGLINNLGFLLNSDADYYCFHDVDLLPEFSDYAYPENPVHMSTFCRQFNYIENPDACMGGVVLFKREHFESVNGYPTHLSGWGSEDNLLTIRCQKIGLKIFKHPFGKFYSVPHKSRLENPIEYHAHIDNGKKREEEREGLTSMWDNGLKNIDIKDFSIIVEHKQTHKHFKVKNNQNQ
jgi:hypothetical protein